MKSAAIFTFVFVIVLIVLSYMYEDYDFEREYNQNVPKIIHLIYIPWDKNQKLKDNYLDFYKSSYEELRDNNPDYNVKLWTLPDIKNFLNMYYPEYYDTIFSLPRPTMIVDFLRLLLVYHYEEFIGNMEVKEK